MEDFYLSELRKAGFKQNTIEYFLQHTTELRKEIYSHEQRRELKKLMKKIPDMVATLKRIEEIMYEDIETNRNIKAKMPAMISNLEHLSQYNRAELEFVFNQFKILEAEWYFRCSKKSPFYTGLYEIGFKKFLLCILFLPKNKDDYNKLVEDRKIRDIKLRYKGVKHGDIYRF